VDEWRKRATVEDLKAGSKNPRSTVLSVEEEAMIVAFRRYSLLPLDDCLYALQTTNPTFDTFIPDRCFQRHSRHGLIIPDNIDAVVFIFVYDFRSLLVIDIPMSNATFWCYRRLGYSD